MTVTVGADPELLLQDSRTGAFVPACGLFGGTKKQPLDYEGLKYHEDNVALELGWEPADSEQTALYKLSAVTSAVQNLLKAHAPEYVALSPAPCALYPDLSGYPGADTFGCEPDYDAYREGAVNRTFNAGRFRTDDGDWRFAGGHIHIGYDTEQVPPHVAALLADVFITLPILRYERQGQRRRYYGTAGRFRPKPYGVEYRTPCSRWFFEPHTMGSIVFGNAFLLGNTLADPELVQEYMVNTPWQVVRKAIRNEDSASGNTVLEHLRQNVKHAAGIRRMK